jgi:hypothetical protein
MGLARLSAAKGVDSFVCGHSDVTGHTAGSAQPLRALPSNPPVTLQLHCNTSQAASQACCRTSLTGGWSHRPGRNWTAQVTPGRGLSPAKA